MSPSPQHLAYQTGLERLCFSEEESNLIVNNSSKLIFKKGDVINSNDFCGGFLIINEGFGLDFIHFTKRVVCGSGIILPGIILSGGILSGNKNKNKCSPQKVKVLEKITAYFITAEAANGLDISKKLSLKISQSTLIRIASHRDVALLRTGISKKEHIITFITLIFLAIKPFGKNSIDIGISDACLLTGVSRQYYTKIILELRSLGIVEKTYGKLKVLDIEQLLELCDYELINYFSGYSRSYILN